MTTATEMPDSVRRLLLLAAVGLGVVAAVGNFGHVEKFATDAGQPIAMAKVIAALPDVLLVLGILRAKYDRSWLAWIAVALSIGFIGMASLATTEASLIAWVVALFPLFVAVIAAGMIESRPAETPEPVKKTGSKTPKKTTGAASGSSGTRPSSAAPVGPGEPFPSSAAGPAGPELPPPGRPLHLAATGDESSDALLPAAHEAARKIRARGENVSKRTLQAELKAAGHSLGDRRVLDLLKEVA